MAYIRYHSASGYVDMKFTVVSVSELVLYAKPGYEIRDAGSSPFGSSYVDPTDGVVKDRVGIALGGNHLVGSGESMVFSGLPSDLWVVVNNNDPVRATNGSLTIAQPTNEDTAVIMLAGKYQGRGWSIQWDSLSDVRTRSHALIDKAAEAARTRVITSGSGQAMTYLRKADAARLFLAGQTLIDAQMLRLTDEATRLGVSVTEAAQSLVATANQWETIDAMIDTLRLTAKDAVTAAATGLDIENIVAGINWPV